uniref:AMP-binding domain-containing protein n=1 Tax=Haemonchus contortus TaxID=6289 RepID=A0A7I4Y407_HAECO
MFNDGVDVIDTIQSNAKAGRIAFVGGERYDETLASIRLYDAARAIANYIACLFPENVSAFVFSENRWEVVAFYLGVRLFGGSVKFLDYTASEEKLQQDFRGCELVLCAGKDLMNVFRGTVEKNVKIIVIPPARIPYNAISFDEVLQIRINRGLSLHNVCYSEKTSRLLRATLQSTGPAQGWTPQNSLCAVIAPLNQRVHFDVAISCILLGIPVLLATVHNLDGFMRSTRNHGIDIVSIDEPTLLKLQTKCDTPSLTVTTVLFEGQLTADMKDKLYEVFPRIRTLREVNEEFLAKL